MSPRTLGVRAQAPALLDWRPTVPELLRRASERFGDRELVVTSDGRRLTYTEVHEESAFWARRLLASGIGKGVRVGLLLPQDPVWLIAYFALARIGAVTVAISTFATPAEVGKILRHSDAHALIAGSSMHGEGRLGFLEQAVDGLAEASTDTLWLPALPSLRTIWLDERTETPWARPPLSESGAVAPVDVLAEVESEVSPSDPVVVVYTSGTTAEPKGVVQTHGALVRHGEALRLLGAIVEGERVLAAMPFFWVGGLSRILGPALHAGATLLTQTRFDADGALDLIETEKATGIAAWDTVLRRIVDHPRFATLDLPSMRYDPRVRRGGLGMTETCGQHTWRRPGEDPASVGSAVPGVEHRVVVPGTETSVGPGEHGEICVRGYCVCTGMVRRERDEVFDRDGWYHTGDGGWISEDGLVYFVARLTEMIKTDGNNVAPAEIEAALRAHPAISFALAFGVPDPTRGEEPVAVVASNEALGEEELRRWVRERLAPYKVPRRILVLESDAEVPLLASGKPDKRRLASMFVEAGR